MNKKISLNDLKPKAKAPSYQMVHNQFMGLLNQSKYEQGLALLHSHLPRFPNNTALLNNIALCQLKLKQYQKAYDGYQQSLNITSDLAADTNVYDGLCEVCHYLDKTDEQQHFGKLAIQTKANLVKSVKKPAVFSEPPPPFVTAVNHDNRLENVISFSLFGDSPRYCETAILNVHWANLLYPEWICRFYVDDSVPTHVLKRLEDNGAQVIIVSAATKSKMSGLFWRFLVIDDPTVKRFIIRDADSLVSYKERAAVAEWTQSGQWFHTMRDYFSHTELILAGMWGGSHGAITNIEQMIVDFLDNYKKSTNRVLDQHFLRYEIYPIIVHSVLMHDSQGFQNNATPMPQPTEKTSHEEHPKFHIGRNIATQGIKITINKKNVSHLKWILTTNTDVLICQYLLPIKDENAISVSLPDAYIEKIKTKDYSVKVSFTDK
ncbi:tetratricopeptide repeat protein [Psychrobacter sp. KCTC 72983]|uniref:tetratricopeptide repeat protein n=1 Tax=Psychrobacter sp. KCTC 72983 TaxID=2733866 RepID=UPI00164467A5|nr:tetratricopeptide repeat protein [Psychrobacter sp. KCTC 72983]